MELINAADKVVKMNAGHYRVKIGGRNYIFIYRVREFEFIEVSSGIVMKLVSPKYLLPALVKAGLMGLSVGDLLKKIKKDEIDIDNMYRIVKG